MASIVSSGIGSGLDIAGIVQQLVAAEGQPVETRIVQQEFRAQSKLSAFGSLKAALSDFRDKLEIMRDQDSFLLRQAISGNEEFFTANASTNALPAKYSVEVVQLAQAQKLTSAAFTDAADVVGTGTLHIGAGSGSFDVDISIENNTLSGIRDAINNADDNAGIAATIVNAESGSYLILTTEDTGASSDMTITQSSGDGGLSVLEYDPGNGLNSLIESIAPQDALIRIDGFDVLSSNNTFTDAIEGISISVKESSVGETSELIIENDQSAARQNIDGFVESYNALVDTFDQLTNFDADSSVAAPLLGDATARNIRDQIRRELSTAVEDIDGPFNTLREVGIEVQLDGRLAINDDEIAAVLSDDFVRFGQLFSNTDGFGVRLFDLTDSYLDGDGIIETRSQGLSGEIDNLGDDRIALNERLASLESRLLRQFNALDLLLGQLSSTSNFLTQQLNNLPGFTRPDRN